MKRERTIIKKTDNYEVASIKYEEEQPKNKRLTLYWVDKLKALQEDNPENPLKALYLFEAWAVEEEDKFNDRWFLAEKEEKEARKEKLKSFKEEIKGLGL